MKKLILFIVIVIILFSCSVKIQTTATNVSRETPKVMHKEIHKVKKWIKPPNLKKGDTIAILSPASYLKDSIHAVTNALDTLKSWGLNYKLYPHVFDRDHRFAGSDKERAIDFQKAINNSNIKAIWCARGGYGSVRIIDKLHLENLENNPKWIIGYSDVTAIHNMLHNFGIQSIHGIMPVNFMDTISDNHLAIKSFKNSLFGIENSYTIKSSKFNKRGNVNGVLVGGNLSLLESMLGSKTSIDTSDKILFIEDIGEYTYRIDRMLYSLKRAGYFENCKGLIVGGFSSLKENDPPFCDGIESLILELLKEYKFPIVFNFPTGHITDNRTMIIGTNVNLKVGKENSTLEFMK